MKNESFISLLILITFMAVGVSGCGNKISEGNIFDHSADNQEQIEVLTENEEPLQSDGIEDEPDGENEVNDPLLKEPLTYHDYLVQKDAPNVLDYFNREAGDLPYLKDKGYVIIRWDEVLNLERYWLFEYRYHNGLPADLVLVQYTDEEEPIFDYLYYDGKEVLHVRDFTKVVTSTKTSYSETMPYLLMFEQRAEENDRYKTLVLSEREDLSYDEFETLFYQKKGSEEMNFIASFFYVEEDK